MFEAIQANNLKVSFTHVENDFDDHLRELLIPHGYSTLGPAIAIDINGDGLEDMYMESSWSEEIYIQKADVILKN